nr:hypothetical protein [Tanacetum cinerariifolium]
MSTSLPWIMFGIGSWILVVCPNEKRPELLWAMSTSFSWIMPGIGSWILVVYHNTSYLPCPDVGDANRYAQRRKSEALGAKTSHEQVLMNDKGGM